VRFAVKLECSFGTGFSIGHRVVRSNGATSERLCSVRVRHGHAIRAACAWPSKRPGRVAQGPAMATARPSALGGRSSCVPCKARARSVAPKSQPSSTACSRARGSPALVRTRTCELRLRPRYAVSRSCFRISSRKPTPLRPRYPSCNHRKLPNVRAAWASSGALTQRAWPRKPTMATCRCWGWRPERARALRAEIHPQMNTFSLLPSRSRKYPA
jgi:hypothetical protein